MAGEPISSLEDGDQFSGFTVHYEDDRVVEIIIVSPRYHTASGVSTKTTVAQFRRIHPKARVTCYSEHGASSTTAGAMYDDIEKGVGLDRQVFEGRSREVINTLSVHRANIPAKIYGEVVPCKK